MITYEEFRSLPVGATVRYVDEGEPEDAVTVSSEVREARSGDLTFTDADGASWYFVLDDDVGRSGWEILEAAEPDTKTDSGTKHDGGKPAFHLLDEDALSQLAAHIHAVAKLECTDASVSPTDARNVLRRFSHGLDDVYIMEAWMYAARLLCPTNPYLAMRLETAKVLDFGATKYAPNNWRGGFKWSRLISAAHRHLDAYARGTICDDETGLHHLAHFSCCMMFLVVHVRDGLGEDDRAEVWPR